MQFFEERLREKISSFWQSFRAEIILISISLVIIVISLAIFIKINNQSEEEQISFEEISNSQTSNFKLPTSSKIYIDLSGAVENPDVYEVTPGARLKDVLVLGNGLSAEADRQFFARNFNLARILTDQEKIYIPSAQEVRQGFFTESSFVVDQIQPRVNNNVETTRRVVSTDKININTASDEALDTLPGVGKVTAQKIIDNRQYNSVEELLTRKVVNKSVYEKIKDFIAVN
jgi:competence protein ComEA